MEKAVSIIVHGTVQGVGFRSFARHHAVKRGIQGWVQNRVDGSVEIHAEGPEQTVNDYVDAIKKGPGWVAVVHAQVSPSTVQEYQEFKIRD